MLAAVTRWTLAAVMLGGAMGCQSREKLRISIVETASRTGYVIRSQSTRELSGSKVDDARFASVFQPSESPKSLRRAISRLLAIVSN